MPNENADTDQNLNTESGNNTDAAISNSDNSNSANNAPTEDRYKKPIFNREQIAVMTNSAKKQGYDEGLKDAQDSLKKEQSQAPVPNNQNSQNNQPNEQQLKQLVENEIDNRANLIEAQRITQELSQKIDAAKDTYSDFNEKVSALNLGNNVHIAMWANSLPNTADVLYDMASNPSKFAQVITLANSGSPQLAVKELKKLSQSIEENKKAKQQEFPNEPLGEIKATNKGLDNGSLSVSAIRKLPGMKV